MLLGDLNITNSFILTLSTIGDILNSLLIYVILTRSSLEMSIYRYSLLKLTICDLLFSLIVVIVLGPDALLPAPVATVNGLAKYFGEEGAKIAFCITIISGMTVFTANNDCCFTRLMIIYQRQDLIDFTFSAKGYAVVFGINLIFSLLVTPWAYYVVDNPQFVIEEIIKRDMISLLRPYIDRPDTVFLAADTYTYRYLPFGIVAGIGFFSFYFFNTIASYLTFYKLSKSRKHLSETSYKLQRQLNIMLVLQNLYPIVAISIPLVLVSGTTLLWGSAPMPYYFIRMPYITLASYPLANASLSFYFVKPYREFFFEKVFCRPRAERIAAERTSSVNSAPKGSSNTHLTEHRQE